MPTSFKTRSNMAVVINLWETVNLYKKQRLPAIIWNKKHSPKQVVSMTHTLGKDVFDAANFKRL